MVELIMHRMPSGACHSQQVSCEVIRCYNRSKCAARWTRVTTAASELRMKASAHHFNMQWFKSKDVF